ncbi:PQQ-binding-like beta-propeller repeat protein [Blastococcus sp. CT_GayMR20]|uniref:outer membrane protein assembly factor BamB family protein n=1 Tax=Blastococcus sp. CT_GayMR20 TaxID=2559609 RepID=UPI001FD726CE|nr:PQQ-binding-like beta-propeller repeat protein [Blastococcus sp. CT_GayMR20]
MRVWVWTAATVALVVVAALLWRGSDAAATESTTAAPADVPPGTPAGAVSEAWSADGGPLPESIVEDGRVIVGSRHGVRALDAVTGAEAWHYTRSNARLCGLTATNGVAVAVFATANRCDEAVALDAETGVRAWTRNVLLRGDAELDSTDRIVLATSPTGVVTLDPIGDNIRWRYAAPEGCRITGSDVGTAGVAVLQRCEGTDAVQLRLLDGFQGGARWTRDLPTDEGAEVRLLGADALLGVLVGDDVQALSAEDGAEVRRLPAADDVQQLTTGGVALFHAGGTLSALDAASGTSLWESPAVGLPSTPVPDKDAATPAALLVPDEDGFAHRDPATGAELGRSRVDDVPAGGTATVVGPVVVYRLADRVLGYR